MPFVPVCRPVTSTQLLLVKRGKGQRVILRHIAARVNLADDLLKLPFTTSLAKLYPNHSSPRPSLISSDCRIQTSKALPHLRIMSDDAYSSFLDKANQDTGASKASTQSKTASTKAVDTEVPATLQGVEQYYVSEADEPFEPVSVKWGGKNMPSENEFGELIGHKGDVSTISTKEFDPKGDYKEVLQAVEKAGDGKARIFRLETGKSRAEYYVVGFDERGGKIVGLKAKAVES